MTIGTFSSQILIVICRTYILSFTPGEWYLYQCTSSLIFSGDCVDYMYMLQCDTHKMFNLSNNTLSSDSYIIYWQFQTEDRPRKLWCFCGVRFWSPLHPQHTEGIHCQFWENSRKIWSSQETEKGVVLEGDTFSICDTWVLCLNQFW